MTDSDSEVSTLECAHCGAELDGLYDDCDCGESLGVMDI